MITFDKLKLVADITAVVNYDETQFEKIEKEGSRTFKYYQETPYLLAIKIDYQEREVVVEFTGKVLGLRRIGAIKLTITDGIKFISYLIQ